jgi:hypothetical protein
LKQLADPETGIRMKVIVDNTTCGPKKHIETIVVSLYHPLLELTHDVMEAIRQAIKLICKKPSRNPGAVSCERMIGYTQSSCGCLLCMCGGFVTFGITNVEAE